MTMDGDIVEFLQARLDEDEALLSVPMSKRMIGRKIVEVPITRLPDYMAKDRERWRREIEAKRQIITYYQGLRMDHPTTDYAVRAVWWVVWQLTKPYSDHPNYNPEWSPS